ncbi:MAG: hypothetical protein KDD35_05270, partial [Bdellovibrionales bacterium]|nr:hypothetical protein [Bdellovibrionales bacterium]
MSISWKDWRRWTVASLAFSGLFFCLGFIYRYHVPRVKTWLLVEIESQSRKPTPFRVWPKNLSLRFFPPQVILEDVRVVPQDSLSESIAPSLIKAVKIKINWLALFRGQFRMAEIAVEQPHIDFNLSKLLFELKTRDSSTNGDKPLDFQFSRLYQIPIDKISLSHLELKAHSSEEKIEIHLYDSSFTITNMFDAFFVQINLPRVKLSKDKLPPFEFGFESRFLLDEENLQVSSFKMRKNSSYLVASGFLQGNFLNGQMLSGKMNSRTHFSLDELRLLAQDYLEKTTLPEAKGAVDLDLELKWRANRLPEIKVQTRGKNIDLSHFIVGDLEGDGLVTKDKILVKKLDIKNTAGHVRL